MPKPTQKIHEYLRKIGVAGSFFFHSMSHIEIETDILNIQPNKAHQNLKTLESIVNDKFSNVYNWLIANKLSLNTKKTNYVIFRPRRKIKNIK